MGFKKLLGIDTPSASAADSPATVTSPPTVTETQEVDTQADYAQRSARKRGLLSTILANRNRTAGVAGGYYGGNTTLG